MKNNRLSIACILTLSLSLLVGCKTPTLQSGGAYSPTNATGQVIYSDIGLALADASYKFAYESALTVFRFEKDHRVEIAAISPTVGLDIKHALDTQRDNVWAIDQSWAKFRQEYKKNPTPANLSTLQSILAEMQRILPGIQANLGSLTAVLTKP